MIDYSKFTTHRAPTGDATGHKENLIKVASSGHQIRVMSTDQYGVLPEAFGIADQAGVEALAVYRPSSEGQNESSKKWNYGQPYPWNTVGHNYTLDAETAAKNHIWAYGEHLKQITEWDDRTWFLFFNEIDHEKLEYCAEVALIMARHAVDNDLKFAFFGMNSGEPNPEHWTRPKMGALLRYMAQNPENLALALHEYSFDKDILNDFGFLVGRYLYLVDACKSLGVDFENIRIFITEGGHGKDMSLSPDSWRESVDQLASVYGSYPNIQMFAFWAISDNSKWDGPQLSAKVREAFDYSAQKATGHDPIIKKFNSGGNVTPPEEKHKAIVLKSPQPPEFSASRWQRLAEYAYTNAHTMTASHDDTLSLLRAGRSDSYVKIVYPELESQAETIDLVEVAGYEWIDVTNDVFGISRPPTVEPPPSAGPSFDLAEYVMPSGVRQYIIKNDSGAQEKYRPQPYQHGHLIQKNGQGEFYSVDERYIYLEWDTTPNHDEFYRRTASNDSSDKSPYLPRFMKVGEGWQHSKPHYVAFYRKSDCSNAGSIHEGWATQSATLVAYHDEFSTKYGATFRDVAVISTGAETQYYAKSFGRIGWESAWGNAWATSEDISNQEPHPLQLPTCL